MLVTTDEPPPGDVYGGAARVAVGWKEPYSTFSTAVKSLEASGCSPVTTGVERAVELLNQYRHQSGIDNYGQGRNPWFSEAATVVVLTDGGKFSFAAEEKAGTVNTVLRRAGDAPGSELTHETYR